MRLAPVLLIVRPVATILSSSSRFPDAKTMLPSVLVIVARPDSPVSVPIVPAAPPLIVNGLADTILMFPRINPLLSSPPSVPSTYSASLALIVPPARLTSVPSVPARLMPVLPPPMRPLLTSVAIPPDNPIALCAEVIDPLLASVAEMVPAL